MPKIFLPEEIKLSNGIPVILQHYEGLVAATYWWVRAGSADEGPGEEGFAHFLEHMLFKDASAKETGKASSGQLAVTVETLGGDINAYTSFDQTVYHVTCADHHWEKIIDAFGTMAKPQRFLRQDFQREREVILEELRKNEDSPGRQMFQSLFSATYARHPYGRPVIGFVKTLKAAKVEKLEAFYRRNYVSGNMGLVLVGPIHDASGERRRSILRLLEKRFGAKVHPKREHTRRPRPVEAPLRKAPHLVQKPFDVKTPTLALSFRVPELRHPDMAALDLATGVLGMGDLSRLHQRLFYETSLSTEVSSGIYVPNDPGMLHAQAEVDDVDKVRRVAEEMMDVMAKLRREPPTTEELNRVLVNAESERLYVTQTADGVAGRLGFLRFVLGDLDFDREYLEELRAVQTRAIPEVLGRYLDYRRMSGTLLLPKALPKYDLGPIAEKAREAFAPEKTAAAPKAARKPSKASAGYRGPRPEWFTLPSGIRVVHVERPQSHVVSAQAVALGGLRLERGCPIESAEADWGSSYMMSLTWTKGAASKDARAISSVVEGHASALDGMAGRNTVGLQMTGLARDWHELSGLFSEVLVEPTFPEDEVGHSRRVAEDSVRSIDDHSTQVCSKQFLETLFEGHPYGFLTTGSMDSLAKINGDKLRAFHRAWIRPERLVIAVSGALRRADLDRWLAELDLRFHAAGRSAPAALAIPRTLEDPRPLQGPRWVEKNLSREQCHIVVGGLGTQVNAADRYAIRLMQTILGGQSGRLFLELREKKSLAYTVSPMSFEGVEKGYIGTYIGCAPQKREEALAGIRTVLETLAAKGPSEKEMQRAKEYVLGRRAMELQSDSALAAHFSLKGIYGIPPEEELELADSIRKVTAKSVREACGKYLVEPPMVTSIVG